MTILQRGHSIFPRTEPALAVTLTELLHHEGIAIETNVTVRNVRAQDGHKVVDYSTGRPHGVDITADAILLTAGKTPNTKALGLDAIGVELAEARSWSGTGMRSMTWWSPCRCLRRCRKGIKLVAMAFTRDISKLSCCI